MGHEPQEEPQEQEDFPLFLSLIILNATRPIITARIPSTAIEPKFSEKTDSIKKQIEDLRVRRNKLLSEDEDERCIEELRHLKRILNDSPKTLSEIDKELFTSIVTKIYAEQNGDITFCLLGELQLRMEVK